jgi:3-dehydroquinate dehydratase type II
MQYASHMETVLVINGPNLNLLGTREPEVYGTTTLDELDAMVGTWGEELGIRVATFQSNHEGDLIDRLHQARDHYDGIVLNAGAFTHYSYAIHDAIAAAAIPTVEVHISNIKMREPWRAVSVVGPACVYSIHGRGVDGYRYALQHLRNRAAVPFATHSYGPDPDQVADLRLPDRPGPHPVVVLIHGGFWRDHWTRDVMDGLAVDLTARGWATWNLEYRRVGSGGGWPETVDDVASGLDALADLGDSSRLDLDRVVAVGHSAGGELALWAAYRPNLARANPGRAPRVELAAAVALAPVADLDSAHQARLGRGAVEEFLGRSPEANPELVAAASPRHLLPLGTPLVVVHGGRDEEVPVAMSRSFVGSAADAGDAVVYHELEEADHFELIDPTTRAWDTVVAELEGFVGE